YTAKAESTICAGPPTLRELIAAVIDVPFRSFAELKSTSTQTAQRKGPRTRRIRRTHDHEEETSPNYYRFSRSRICRGSVFRACPTRIGGLSNDSTRLGKTTREAAGQTA